MLRGMPRSVPRLPSFTGCICAALLGALACKGGSDPARAFGPTGPVTLSPGNLAGQDEDPSIVRALDGSLYVAWYSNRNPLQPDGLQDKEIFLMRSADGATWTDPPIQLTRSPVFAFYPSLAQDASGVFHLAWWRLIPLPPGCDPDAVATTCTGTQNRIVYKSSPDGVTWDLDQEQEIATGPGDWLPSLVADRIGGRLLVYFAAVARDQSGNVNLGETTLRIFVVIHDGNGWSAAPTPLTGVNVDTSHNTYPHVVQKSDGSFLMTWTRYDAARPNGVLQVTSEPSTATMFSTSADGISWTPPVVMSDPVSFIDVFPYLYGDQAGAQWYVSWLTTAFSASGGVVELPVGGTYPGEVTARPELGGYTARIVATSTPGIYWGVWVEGAPSTQKIRHRFFAR